ncbi:MAG: peptide deformylase [Clostridiales bacterium]|nr:peptide deformylase [Clostridiales bacterium]
MAKREICLLDRDDCLRKHCKEVEVITPRIRNLIYDMIEAMYNANGVGLAAPQVGVLRRIVVIDVNPDEEDPIVLINPEITYMSEEKEKSLEGCLSVPGRWGYVERPKRVRVRAADIDGTVREIEGEGLLAKAICHECDHLNGVMFVDHVIGRFYTDEDLKKAEEKN